MRETRSRQRLYTLREPDPAIGKSRKSRAASRDMISIVRCRSEFKLKRQLSLEISFSLPFSLPTEHNIPLCCHTLPCMAASPVVKHTVFPDDCTTGDETRPLLHDAERGQTRCQPSTPLPRRQLATLCAIRLVDPVAFTQIFPYVNEMMERFGIAEPSKTGFYSGLVVCLFPYLYAL